MSLVIYFVKTCIKTLNFDICLVKSIVITIELCYIVDIYLMSTDVWAQVTIFTHIGTDCHVIGTCCILGRPSRTKEILPDFREWCRVT